VAPGKAIVAAAAGMVTGELIVVAPVIPKLAAFNVAAVAGASMLNTPEAVIAILDACILIGLSPSAPDTPKAIPETLFTEICAESVSTAEE